MSRSTGITENTSQRTVYGAGVVIRNYDRTKSLAAQDGNFMGATKGGSELKILQDIKYPDVDGARGKLKGMAQLTKDTASAKITFVDLDLDTLLDALPGATFTDDGGGKGRITRAAEISSADHNTNIAVVTDHKAKDGSVGFILDNPLAMGELGIKFADDFSVLELEVEAHYDPATPDTRPWTLLWPSPSTIS